MLSAAERRKATRFVDSERQHQFIIGRAFLRFLVSRYIGCDPEKVVFGQGPFGKPCLIDRPWLQFNVSHSHDAILLAFANTRRIGIDVQRIDSFDLTPSVVNQVFAPSEMSELRGLGKMDESVEFSRRWVVKEAYVKAVGCGLCRPLSEFRISLGANKGQCYRIIEKDGSSSWWKFQELEITNGYSAAVAVEGIDWRLKYDLLHSLPIPQ